MFFSKKAPERRAGASNQHASPPANSGGATYIPGSAPAAAVSEDARKRAGAAKQLSATFGSIVAILMRSADEKSLSLHDLEWLVLPALARGQFAVAEAQPKEAGAIMPVGVVLWAFVSPEVDQRLAGQTSGALRLAPEDWRSGDIPWIIVRAGEAKIVGKLLEQLSRTVFKARPPRMRVRDAEGKVLVGRIEIKTEPKITT